MVSTDNLVCQVLWNWFFSVGFCNIFLHLKSDLLNWPICKITKHVIERKKYIILFTNNLAGPVNLVKLAWTSRSQYLLKIMFLSFTYNLAKFQWKDFFKWLFYLFWVKILCSVPKHNFYVCYISTIFQLQVLIFLFNGLI